MTFSTQNKVHKYCLLAELAQAFWCELKEVRGSRFSSVRKPSLFQWSWWYWAPPFSFEMEPQLSAEVDFQAWARCRSVELWGSRPCTCPCKTLFCSRAGKWSLFSCVHTLDSIWCTCPCRKRESLYEDMQCTSPSGQSEKCRFEQALEPRPTASTWRSVPR